MSDTLRDFIANARWFGGKGRDWTLTGIRRVGELPDPPPGLHVTIELAELTYASGETELYQLPLAYYSDHQERLEHASVGEWDDDAFGHAFVYDALHDRQAMGLWLRAFAEVTDGRVTRDRLAFHRVAGHELDLDVHSTLFSGEQSNSSVAFGEDSLMKVFRKVTPGVNPDISIHEVLTRAGSEHVAALYGWLDVVDDEADTTIQLAMLQQFLRTASDGWELALSSVRNLFAEADLHAEEVGGDFAGEASRLGTALAETHATLAAHFPVTIRSAAETAALADAMRGRLDAALDVVPGLAEHASALRATYDALAALGEVEVQQVHGDLHLGQTLRTVRGWKIVDFEGEPATPLAERMLPDSPVARRRGDAPLLRLRTARGHDDRLRGRPGRGHRGPAVLPRDRVVRTQLIGVPGGVRRTRELTAEEQTLLSAYVADKAVYEAVYEARNRPTWVGIPLDALARMEQA